MVLAFDIGTSVLKGGLISSEGKLLARAQAAIDMAPGAEPSFHEFDPRGWLQALRKVSGELFGRAAAVRKTAPECLVVSGNGPTLVPVDASGEPAYHAINWMDRRGVEEAELISSLTGINVDSSFFLPKAYWIYRRKPEVYARTRWFLSCPEYIDFVLTGEAYTVLPSPGFSPYIWTESAIDKLRMDPEKFPPFIKPGRLMGKVRPAAAKAFGIPADLPVISGGPDFIMSLLGTATISPGRSCDRAGSSEGVNLCADKPVADGRLLSLPHIIEGYTNVSGLISTTGKALDWLRSALGLKRRSYEALLKEAAQCPPGAGGLLFLPYLAGERSPLWDPEARGAFIGLSLRHSRPEMVRAVVEAACLAILDVLQVMEENGLRVEELRVTGGQSRSPVWNQIKADVTGRTILVPEVHDSELLGCACVGLFAMGRYPSLSESSERCVRIAATLSPRAELQGFYRERFELYRASYQALKPIFPALNPSPMARKSGLRRSSLL